MKRVVLRTLLYLLLILGALIMVFPFYWMIASSFKTSAGNEPVPAAHGALELVQL